MNEFIANKFATSLFATARLKADFQPAAMEVTYDFFVLCAAEWRLAHV